MVLPVDVDQTVGVTVVFVPLRVVLDRATVNVVTAASVTKVVVQTCLKVWPKRELGP